MTDLKVIKGGGDDYEMTTDEIISIARTFTQPQLRRFLQLLGESIAVDEKALMRRKRSLRVVP
jgi:hypothetical protein